MMNIVLIQQTFFISKIIDKALSYFLMVIKCNKTIRIFTVSLVLLTSLSACNSESNKVISIEPVPSDNMRTYLLGDVMVFSGDVTVTKIGVPTSTSPVEVLVELLPGKFDYLDKVVLTIRQTTTFIQSGEQQIVEQDIWQESNGSLFELSNEYGNEYVIGTASEKGLLSIPVPFIDFEKFTIDFFTMYGGPVSGPITEGNREITVAPIQTIDTVLGEYQVYQLTHQESYKYLFTYVDNKNDSTVVTEKNMWISPEIGLIKSNVLSSQYSPSGVLQSQNLLSLDIESMNF
jgi:hypothetical protein